MQRMMIGAAVMVMGCGQRLYGPCNGANEATDGEIDLGGEVPVFDWRFGTAYAISVSEDDDGQYGRTVWPVQGGGENGADGDDYAENVCLRTPIAYGERVDSPHFDTVNYVRPKPLVPGKRYLVSLNTLTEADPEMPEPERPDWLEFLPTRERDDDPSCGSGFTAELAFVAPGEPNVSE